MTGVARSHHVLGVKHLLCQLRHRQSSVLLAASRGERSKAGHEEVKTREWNHVDCQLTKVSIQLARKTEAGCDSTHGGRNQVVEVSVGRCGELESSEADVVEGFVVNAVCFVGVLNQLVN